MTAPTGPNRDVFLACRDRVWMVLEDLVGNRFCIVRSDAERAAQAGDRTV